MLQFIKTIIDDEVIDGSIMDDCVEKRKQTLSYLKQQDKANLADLHQAYFDWNLKHHPDRIDRFVRHYQLLKRYKPLD